MFDFIRTHQRLMQLLLLLLIFPSFALIGVSGYSTYTSGDHDLVRVAGSPITQQEFDQARTNQLQQMQQASRGNFDPALIDTKAARSELLESLIDRRVLIATASKDRFSVSDTALRQTIASMPELQVDGRFSPERYNEVLKSIGTTSKDFEQGQRAELALQRVLGPVGMTAKVPSPVVESIKKALIAERVIRLHAYAAKDYEKDITVSDADIQAWYEKNKQELELPEQVGAQYLLLNEAAAMDGLPAVSTADMLKYYEQNKARYVQPARVLLSHILITVPLGATSEQHTAALHKAEQIAKAAAASQNDFADLARKESQDAGTAKEGGRLGWITRGSWPAPLEKAAFALKKGEVSGVVEGSGGFHIFRADDVQAEKGETFDQAKSKVENEIRRQLGADRFADMATKLTSLVYDNQNSLQPAADALGLKVKSVDGITRGGLLPESQAGKNAASASSDAAIFQDARVRRALFSGQTLTEKLNSGVIEISPDTMIVVRVDKVTPAHVQPLEQVTALIRQRLTVERARQAAVQAGQEALATLQKADDSHVPDSFGSPLTVSRINPQGVGKPVVDAALDASSKTLPSYAGITGPQGYVVVYIEQAKAGAIDDSMLAGLPLELDQSWGRAQEQAVLKALRTQAKVKILPEAEKVLSGELAPQS